MKINANGYIINVAEVNPLGKETVFFLHGWPLSHKMFEYQWNTLAKQGIRCIGIDLIGFGSSSKPYNGYSYDELADLLEAVFVKLALSNFTLLAFSMGGAVAVRYLSRIGQERIKKLILIGAACPSFVRRPDFAYGNDVQTVDMLINAVGNDKPHAFSEFGDLVLDGNVSPEFANWFLGISNESAIWSAQSCLESLKDEDLREDCKNITIPTAIFHGTQDKVCPFELAEQSHLLIKNSFILPFDFSGHGVFYEERDKLNIAIIDFVTDAINYPISTQGTIEETLGEPPKLDSALDQHYPFKNVPLPYSYSALEPSIDQKTMDLHHDKHLSTYIDNLNTALEKYPEFHSWSLTRLITQSSRLPDTIRQSVERNAGGVYNHFFYFDGMTARKTPPSASLTSILNKNFGSLDVFVKKLSDAAMSVFGSGYAWLVANKNRELEIITTANQNTPLVLGKRPLLNIDVWEHAYYLKHFNKRADYLEDWFGVVDWHAVEIRLM